ncbi:MAG: LacI family DNA-binding transcriptional regulator [Victivallales bacterium]|nr:LacI family DNA-binding transcriptional regulator [Victivallales bacterium]
MKNCSLKDVACECGVSVMTVSRAFRESSSILPATRDRILATAERMGYCYMQRRGRSPSNESANQQQVQLIFGNASNQMYYFHMRLLASLEQHLAQSGLECLIRTCNGNYPIFVRMLDRVRSDLSVGTFVLGSFVQDQLETLLDVIPNAILLDNQAKKSLSRKFTSLSFDNRNAAMLAVEHLHARGRRKILMICGPEEHFFSHELLQGYRDAHNALGLPVDEARIRHADFSAAGAAALMHQVFEEGLDFDAVFTNDEMAAGVYRVLHERRLRIPEDIAVCGCDDLPIGAQLYPSLTTISLNYNDLACCAVQTLLSMRQAQLFPEIRLPVALCPRSST